MLPLFVIVMMDAGVCVSVWKARKHCWMYT